MADQYVPLPVKTKTAGDIVANINNGTVTSVSNLAAGTITSIVAGTQNTLGTVGVVNSVAAGTQNTLGTVGVINNVVKGTVTALESGTLTALAVGTVGGKAASGAAAVANPVLIAGTDAGGTIYAPVVTAAGALSVSGASAGTYVNIVTGTQETLGTVGVVNNLVKGTITKVEGGTVGEVTNLTSGSVRMTVGTLTGGTLQNLVSGTINALASGTITAGTVTVTNLPGATDPKMSYQTSAALAAGAMATISFTAITNAKTGQLQKVMSSSSVPIRSEVQRIEDTGGTIGTAGVLFTSAAHPTTEWNAPADNFFTQASTGTAKFRNVITNMDNALAADVYSTAFWDEI